MVEDSTYELERQLLAKYEQELAAANADYAEAMARVERYELGIRGLKAIIAERQAAVGAAEEASESTPPPTAESPEGAEPQRRTESPQPESKGRRGEDAVRRVLMDHPRQPFTPKDIADVLRERGWISPGTKHPVESARAAANRLRYKEDEPFVYRDGKYIYVPSNNGSSLDLFVPGQSEA